MDTEILRDFVISLKPTVISAKAKLKAKLCHHIQTLKRCKTKSEEEKLKNEKKMGRLKVEVDYISNADLKELVKFVLTSELTFDQVLQQETGDETLNVEMRGKARISEHKPVSNKIKQFRIENEDWKTEIPKLLSSSDILEKIDSYEIIKPEIVPSENSSKKKWKKKKKQGDDKENLEQETKTPKEKKEIKKKAKNEVVVGKYVKNPQLLNLENTEIHENEIANETLEQVHKENDEPESDKDQDNESETDNENEDVHGDEVENVIEDEESDIDENENEDSENSNDDNAGADEDSDDNSDQEAFANSLKSLLTGMKNKNEPSAKDSAVAEKQKAGSMKKKADSMKKIEKKSGTTVVKVFDMKGGKKELSENIEDSDSDNSDSNDASDQDESFDEAEESETVNGPKLSSFFIGGVSDEEENDKEGENDNEKNHHRVYRDDESYFSNYKNDFNARGRGRWADRGGRGSDRGGRGGLNRGGRGRDNGGDWSSSNNNTFGGKRESAVDEQLHPSWAAKKRAKMQSVAGFQGKKTVFGDDGGESKVVETRNYSAPQVDKNVHPSWAAKQNQKTSIKPFAGKKTVFGDDDDDGDSKVVKSHFNAPKSVDKDVHPSWAAKQNQKTSIKPFAGKKTVFGDDASERNSFKFAPKASKPAVDENVHPSWAAKQNQKTSIKPFEGKKVVFDDDD